MRCVHAGGRRSAATGTAAADDSIKAAVTAGAPAAQRIRRARRLMRSLRDSSGAVQRDGGAGPGGGAGAAAINGPCNLVALLLRRQRRQLPQRIGWWPSNAPLLV